MPGKECRKFPLSLLHIPAPNNRMIQKGSQKYFEGSQSQILNSFLCPQLQINDSCFTPFWMKVSSSFPPGRHLHCSLPFWRIAYASLFTCGQNTGVVKLLILGKMPDCVSSGSFLTGLGMLVDQVSHFPGEEMPLVLGKDIGPTYPSRNDAQLALSTLVLALVMKNIPFYYF